MNSHLGAYRQEVIAQLPVLTLPHLDPLPIQAVVTTRHGGVSEGPYESLNLGLHVEDDPQCVIENRRRAASTIGLGLDDLVFASQVHGATSVEVTGAHRGAGSRSLETSVAKADAMVTTQTGMGLAILVADCVPILLYDPEAHVLGCVHAGWRGTVGRTSWSALAMMVDRGAQRKRILAAIGPAIPPSSYQVGDEVAAAARNTFGGQASQVLKPDGHGRWRFDLWGANRLLLEGAGVPEANITTIDLPTGGADFFSDRSARPCGRFALLASLDSSG